MKGIVLAGGSGTRLHPLTLTVSKQMMPIYNKPMIYYPISTLMEGGIREILIISTPRDQEGFQKLLGDGSQIGCKFQYAIQEEPNGLAEAFIIGEEFIGEDPVCLILGDNIFYGSGMSQILQEAVKRFDGRDHDDEFYLLENAATIFAYQISDPTRYGVVQFNQHGKVIGIEEKPLYPKSPYAIPGIYFYTSNVVSIAKNLKPSERGELEITDINRIYLESEKLYVSKLDKGTAWLDTGTFESLMQASQYVQTLEERQGILVGSIEEVAFRKEYIDSFQLSKLVKKFKKSEYGNHLQQLIDDKVLQSKLRI